MLALIQFAQHQLEKERFSNPPFYLFLSIIASLVLTYGWLEGKAVFEFLRTVWQGYKIVSMEEFISALITLVTRGGYVEI